MAGPSLSGYKARYVSAYTATVGSATLPQGSLYAVATSGFALVECAFFKTTTGTTKVALQRLTTAGTQGATQAVAKYDDDAPAAVCTPKQTHTVAPTLGDIMHPMATAPIIGSGEFYGFHDQPIEVASGTANGIGFLPSTAIGDHDVMWVWEE